MRMLSKIEIAVAGLNVFAGILGLLGKSPILALCNFVQVPAMLCLAWSGRNL